jgi:hypothetical protein
MLQWTMTQGVGTFTTGIWFVYTPRPATMALVEHARDMIEDAFGGRDPRTVQY